VVEQLRLPLTTASALVGRAKWSRARELAHALAHGRGLELSRNANTARPYWPKCQHFEQLR